MARTLVEYVAEDGRSPFARWFDALDSRAAAKVSTNLYRLEGENWSNVKSVGSGVFEQRVDFGPGYRIYFGQDGDVLVVLLGGGSKKGQREDIKQAQDRWAEYKRRKRRSR